MSKKPSSDPSNEQQEETEFVPIKVNSINPVRFGLLIFSIVLTIGVGVWFVKELQGPNGLFYTGRGQVTTQPSESVQNQAPVNQPSEPVTAVDPSSLVQLTFNSKWSNTKSLSVECQPKEGGTTMRSKGSDTVAISVSSNSNCKVTATNQQDASLSADVPTSSDSPKDSAAEYDCFPHGQSVCIPQGFTGISFIAQQEVGFYSANCDGLKADGQGRLDMALDKADKCTITTAKDNISFDIENLKKGNYVCFVLGQPLCVPEGHEDKVVPIKEVTKAEQKKLKKEKGISFERDPVTLSKTEVTGPGYLSISADWASTVFVDGKKIRKSPLYKHSVKSGKRRISLFSEKGIIQKFSITVKPGHLYTYQWSFEKSDWLMKDINNLAKSGSKE